MSLMSSYLLLQQCLACLVRLTLITFVIGGRWPHSCCLVGCCFQDLFNIARSILVYLPSIFFSIYFISVHVQYPYSSIDTIAVWKKLCFILSVRSDFHMTDSLSIAVHYSVFLWSCSSLYNHALQAGLRIQRSQDFPRLGMTINCISLWGLMFLWSGEWGVPLN